LREMVLNTIVGAWWFWQIQSVESRQPEALVGAECGGRAQAAAAAVRTVAQIGTDHRITAGNLQQIILVAHEIELADFLLATESGQIVLALVIQAMQVAFDRLGERRV